jgi:NAD(P)-dependent dehydrogenase (short-subunit alcohol dehydrogenase family)
MRRKRFHGAFHQEKPYFAEADRQTDREIVSDDTVNGDMETANKRVVLVTGASSGIGLACATHMAGRGFSVYGTSRRPAITLTDNLTMLTTDVTSEYSVDQTVAEVLDREGRLDILVNNAGMGIAGPVEATSIDEAKQQFEVNFFGVLRVCRAVLPAMRGRGSGYIVNIGSIGGVLAIPYQAMYSASKFALEGLSEALRMEVRSFGIRVVIVEPGDHKTLLTQNRQFTEMPPEAYRKSFATALARTAHDEQSGPGPEQIARLLYRIVNRRNPRLRYTIGPAAQRGAVWLKRLAPNSILEHSMRTYYGLDN